MINLATKVFQNDLDFKVLKDVLDSLDHIVPKKISRKDYNFLSWDVLKTTWNKDKWWEFYEMYFPEDLVFWELLYFIDLLNSKFNLKNNDTYKKIISKIQIYISIIYRQKWRQYWNKFLLNLKEKYNIWDEFVKELQNSLLLATEYVKQDIREIISYRKNENNLNKKEFHKKKLWKHKNDLLSTEKLISENLQQELDLTFFRKAEKMLFEWMEIINQTKQYDLEEYYIKNGFEKSQFNGFIFFKKWNEKIVFREKTENLKRKIKLLKNHINIKKWKNALFEARQAWDKEKIEKLEHKAAGHILKYLYKIPYIFRDNNYWFQPKYILMYKEQQCVWFSLIWHVFLKELWIKHNWLMFFDHSALELYIWNKIYLFDWANNSVLKNINYWEKVWEFDFRLKNSLNVEKILLWQIYISKWIALLKEWKHKEAIEIFNKAELLK